MTGIENSCCFTGHRALPPEQLQQIQADIQEKIIYLYSLGIRTFYAGGALGFDMLAGISTLNLNLAYPGISLRLALPCPNHDARWPDTQQQLLKRLIDRADSVVYACDKYTYNCMSLRNRYMVDRAKYCLCYLDKKNRGGTASTVEYAKKKDRTIINLC